jgi:hypothetical protein
VVCLGDGQDGVWKIISQTGSAEQRIEILDWYHYEYYQREGIYSIGSGAGDGVMVTV